MRSFLHMLTLKVDPFAVYRAERRLADADIYTDRQFLINHYLIQGQLDTFVQAAIDAPRPVDVENVAVEDIIANPQHEPHETVGHIAWAAFAIFAVLVGPAAIAGFLAYRDTDHLPVGIIRPFAIYCAVVLLFALLYANLRWWLGKKPAHTIIMTFGVAAAIASIIWLASQR